MTTPTSDGRYIAYLDDWGDLTVLLPQNPDILDTCLSMAEAAAYDVQYIGSGIRLMLRQNLDLMRIKRLMNDNGGSRELTRKDFHVNAGFLSDYPPALVTALRDGDLLPADVDTRKQKLPFVLLKYRRSEDDQMMCIFPDDTVDHMADLIPPAIPLPPESLFELRTHDVIRTDVYNAWRQAFYVAALPKAVSVQLRGWVLVIEVSENSALEVLSVKMMGGDSWTEVCEDLLEHSPDLPQETLTFLKKNSII